MGNEIEFTIDGAGLKGAPQTRLAGQTFMSCSTAARYKGNFA